MEAAVIYFIILGASLGLSEASGILEDDLQNGTIGDKVMFRTNLEPAEKPLPYVGWTTGVDYKPVVISDPTSNKTIPEYEGRITLYPSTGSLEIKNLTLSDKGLYRVTVQLTGNNQLMGRTRLNLYERVHGVKVTPQSVDLVEFNHSVSLSCSSSGSSLSFLWMNSSSQVTVSDRVQINTTDGGSTLTITNISRYDQAFYWCCVSNPASSNNDSTNLSVSYGPENLELLPPASKDIYTGSNISLNCSAESRPSAHFLWFLDGIKLSETGPELHLRDIQPNQSGKYQCQAFNNKSLRYRTSLPLTLTVKEIPSSAVPSNVGAIAGGSIGGLMLIAGFGGVGVYYLRKSKEESFEISQEL